MSKDTVAAIPTVYKGIQMRSRLEARWAAFFDSCRWTWSYEPLEHDGWIPDFVIHGAQNITVEIKPVFEFSQGVMSKIDGAYPPCDVGNQLLPARGEDAEVDHRIVMIFGAEPFHGDRDGVIKLGWSRVLGEWNAAYMSFWDDGPGIISLSTPHIDYITGRYSAHRPGDPSFSLDECSSLCELWWNQAKNETQWKGKQAVC